MKILMNKKTGIIVTTIFIFLMSSSIFSLVNASSLLTDITVEIEEPKNTLKTGATSHLLNGMDVNHGTADVGGNIFPSNFDYTLIPSDLNDVLSSYSAPSILTILFDEAHYPVYSIGSNPAYETVGAYSEFAATLTAAGHTVDTIDPGTVIDATVLSGCDILVIVVSMNTYTTAELDAIEAWVTAGGSLLLISDWNGFGTYVDPLAARFGFDFKNDGIEDSDDGVGTVPLQFFYDGPNIISHPITAGVTRVESYAGDGLIAAPGDEAPIIITDTDGTATWYYGGTPALGVSFMSAVDDGSVGAGKVVVIGDCNIWDSANDFDSDGDINFYDSDNEVLAWNTINWLAPTPSTSITILFDEAHLPVYSIGSNPAYSVVGGYSEFAGMLTAAGHIVDTIDPGTVIDATVLSECDILVIVLSMNGYTTAELDAIETWVVAGGSVLLITDRYGFGTYMDPLVNRFGFDFKDDILLDSDDGLGTGDSSQLFYDGPNILSHPITTGVSRVESYAGDGLIAAPVDEIPIIITDTDGTATWSIEGTPALGVSFMSAVDDGSAGAGKVVVIGDCNVWDSANDVDSDGDLDFYDSDNEILAMNTINWLAPALIPTILFDEFHSPSQYIGGGYSEFAGMLTAEGYIVDTIDSGPIDATVLSKCDILVITCSQDPYTTAELDAIETWVQNGGSLLLITDWNGYGTIMDTIATRFGFDFKNDGILDSDDDVGGGGTGQNYYDGPNILSHPITTGVSRVEMYAGDGLSVGPVDEIPIIITDTDGTATWVYEGTPALGVSLVSVIDDGSAGAGKVCVIGDSNIWDSTDDSESDGTVNFYDSDNEILAMNIINWLAPALHDSLNVTSPDNSSVWETGTIHSITWTSEGSITNVKIELYEDGVFVLEITANTTNDGEFSWTIPAGLDDSTQYQINISDVSNPDTYDLSDNFEIFTTPEITVTSPDSSSSWETSTTHSITWTSEGSITDVKIELYKDGVFVLEIVASTANDGEFSWTIPAGLDDSTQYQVNISDVSNPDTHDLSDYFEIYTPDSITVTSPDSSSSWEAETTHSVTWTSTGSITNVKIELYKDGVFVLEIVASTANDGEYSWTIPAGLDNSTLYQIKIMDVSAASIYDYSEDFEIFTIPEVEEDSITVTNPSTATAWEMGTSHAITWTSTGSITHVKIELFKDGVFVLEIVANTANDGSYTWAIPTDLEDGIDYQIKISDVSNPATYDESPNFAITSIDIPEDGDGIIPSYNLYIIIGIICVVSVILVKNRKKIKIK